MACSVTKGRLLSCKDQRGGIKNIDFAVYSEYGFSVTGQEIATLPVLLTEVFRYEVKATVNNLAEAGTVNQDNRTTEIVSTLSVTLPKLDKETEVEIMALAAGRTIAFVHDYNGNVKVMGIDSGVDASGFTSATGGAGGDLSGYTITLTAMDSKLCPFLSAGAKTALDALVSDVVIEP
jgi:hypothetical protein